MIVMRSSAQRSQPKTTAAWKCTYNFATTKLVLLPGLELGCYHQNKWISSRRGLSVVFQTQSKHCHLIFEVFLHAILSLNVLQFALLNLRLLETTLKCALFKTDRKHHWKKCWSMVHFLMDLQDFREIWRRRRRWWYIAETEDTNSQWTGNTSWQVLLTQ